MIEAGNSSKANNGKGKKFKQVASKTSSIFSTDKKVKKNPKKAKCFACGKVGHFKRDCKANLAKKSKGGKCDLLYIEACLVEESKDTWVIDSGSTNHVCVFLQGFRETRSLVDRSFTLRTGDGNLVLAETVGEVHLYFDEFRVIILRD